MENGRGAFITIEGVNRETNAAQRDLLAKYLREAGLEVITIDFPRTSQQSGYFVKKYLNGEYGDSKEVGAYTASMFYALDRYEAASEIREATAQGKIVLTTGFSGETMAQQGTQLVHAEQRRGYFIWLDHLEFEVFKAPRPDLSLVLSVPASPTAEKTAQVYGELCQLFPNDFQLIDCERNGQLIEDETIAEIILRKVEPLLPVKKQNPGSNTSNLSVSKIENGVIKVGLSGSQLLAQKLEWAGRLEHFAEQDLDKNLTYYTPGNLGDAVKKQYRTRLGQILELHGGIVASLVKHVAASQENRDESQARNKALDTARAVLPVAIKTDINFVMSAGSPKHLAIQLLNDELQEAQQCAKSILDQVDATVESNSADNSPGKEPRKLAQEYLPSHYIGESDPVQLISVHPRNELDLVAHMLYGHSSLPLPELQKEVSNWSYQKKLEVFNAYTKESAGQALEQATYTWDMLCDYDTFRLLRHRVGHSGLQHQQLTPRYGYGVPQIVEEADLTEQFQECFDLSLKLYSLLQEMGYPIEAQYATLLGHKLRCKVTLSARDFLRLHKTKASPSYHGLVDRMHEKLSEAHPLIAQSLNS